MYQRREAELPTLYRTGMKGRCKIMRNVGCKRRGSGRKGASEREREGN
jgi:hypothetical protein